MTDPAESWTSTGATSLEVRFRNIDVRKGSRGSTYRVRWTVGTREFSKTFKTRALADGFRAEMRSATRKGEPFDLGSGRPVSEAREAAPTATWFDHATEYVDMKWKFAAPKSRAGIVETMTAVTLALVRPDAKPPADLRRALYGWVFNPSKRKKTPPDLAPTIAWIKRNSLPVVALTDPRRLRVVVDGLSCKQDGTPAAAATYRRKRAVFNNSLEYAVELRRLPANPLAGMRRTGPRVPESIDPRVLVDQTRAEALLAAVGRQGVVGSRLVAFFACMYYAALRPAEATELRETNLVLPDDDDAWGELRLSRSSPAAGTSWTDTGHRHQPRQLKHRAVGDVRVVPCHPRLVKLLRAHIAEQGTTPDGRLFRGTRGGPIAESSYGKVWAVARRDALSPVEVASAMALRPYDLRHACVTTWLNATGDPAQVAAWAGHGVNVLLRVYVRCVVGGDAAAKEKIERALADRAVTPLADRRR